MNNYTIKVGSGKHTYLDKAYSQLIRHEINNSEILANRWQTYEMVIKEILSLNDEGIFNLIKYRVTDGENIHKVLLDVMYNEIEPSLVTSSLINKVEEYYNIDWLKKYYL